MHEFPIFLIFLYFFGRLFFYGMDAIVQQGKTPWSNIFKRIFIGLFLILFLSDLNTFIIQFFIYTLMITTDSFHRPSKLGNGYFYSFQMASALFFWPYIVIVFSNHIHLFYNPLHLFSLNKAFALTKAFYIATGYLLTIKEGTIFIRLILNRISAVPQKNFTPPEQDEQEYERGRLIGILERTFVYFLILFNQIGAIAVIIALKSLARFGELNKKDFAEYFLIGSLLSLLVASIPAIGVKFILVHL